MNILITGADRPLGALAASRLRDRHRLQLTGAAPALAGDLSGMSYCQADLRQPDQTAPLVQAVDAVLHLDPYDPAPVSGAEAEQERLDIAARGAYVLLKQAREAGVERAIVASTLELFEAYPEAFVVDETWQPQPAARAEALAPMMCELTAREFAREGGIRVICLRFGKLGDPKGTSEEEALRAFEEALALEFGDPGYRWGLFHISSGERFATSNGQSPLAVAQVAN